LQVLKLPQSSVALQVRVIVRSCGQEPATVASLNVSAGVPSQLSVAVALPVLAGNVLAVHNIVILAGQVMAGAKLSSTNMVWLHVLVLPQSSVALQVRVIVRSCGQVPATVASVKVISGTASQLSVAVAVPVLAGNVLAVHWIVILAGQVITGPTLSSTNMVCAQLLEFPQSSVATHVRVMVRSCGQAPPVVISLNVIVGVGSQLSVAPAVPVLAGKVLAVQAMVILSGQSITGGVPSWT